MGPASPLSAADLAHLAPHLLARLRALFESWRAYHASVSIDSTELTRGLHGRAAVDALLAAAATGGLTRVRRLSLASVGLSLRDLEALADSGAVSALTAPWLATVDLDDNEGLGPDAGAPLARLLTALPSVTALQVRGSSLGPAGVRALAAALPVLRGLTSLGLGGAGMAAEGAAALAEQLAAGALPLLATLMLGGNCLRAEGAAALLPRLRPSLVALHLGGNLIGGAGVAALASVRRMMGGWR